MLRKLAEAFDNRHERKSLRRLSIAFNEQMRAYLVADFLAQVGAELSVRTVRHAFAATYPQLGDFMGATHAEKSAYLSKVSAYVERLSKEENSGNAPKGVTNGALLSQFWIAALAWGDYRLADTIAEKLEPLNRSTYKAACADGQARPDDEVLAEWKEMFGENIIPNALMR